MSATVAESDPAVVVKATGEPISGLPLMSMTTAEIVAEPPTDGTAAGFALTETLPTAAVPTATFTDPVVPVVAPPEIAEIVAVPFEPPAMNITCTRPPVSVEASEGSTRPSVVVKVTRVPLCGGVPADSST